MDDKNPYDDLPLVQDLLAERRQSAGAMKYIHLEKLPGGATWRLSTCVRTEDLWRFLPRLEGDDVEFVVPGTFPFKTVSKVNDMAPE